MSYSALMVFYCFGGFLFYNLFYRSNDTPRLLSVWGMAAVTLGFIGTLLEIFQFEVPLYVFLPILPFELTIGIWLVVKGFHSSSTISKPANTDTTGIK